MNSQFPNPCSQSRVKRRKEARPGEIIEAGLMEFADKGFAATRLIDVAKRAGITKGTIYRYFADKEALFLAAVDLQISHVFKHTNEQISEFEGSTRQLLTMLFSNVHRNIVQGDMYILLRIILIEGKNFPQLPKLYYREGVTKGQQVLKRIIERGIERGEVRRGAASDLPIVVMAPALMAAIWKMMFHELQPVEPEKFYAAHVDLVMNGLLENRQH